jgi:hypothetical protein
MSKMTRDDYEELINLLDGRIDELTKPVPSRQILRFAEAIRSARLGDDDSVGTYSEEDYENLQEAQAIVNECLPQIMENIRVQSIDPESGWRMESVSAGNGDAGLCVLCRHPYQHFDWTVKVHCLAMHPDAYHGVCRGCVRKYAPLTFVESEPVDKWLRLNSDVCESVEPNRKIENQRVALIDAIRAHAHSTHYFAEVVQKAPTWAKGAFGEWR